MRYASDHFDAAASERIARAVHDAESRTQAEIIPIVATSSGRYDRAEDRVGVLTALGAFVIVWLAFQREDPAAGGWDGLPLTLQLPVLVAVLLAGFAVGAIVATQVAWLRRRFVSRAHMAEEVWSEAARLFFDRRIHHTRTSSGTLIYVSLFERRAVILADQNLCGTLGPDTLQAQCAALTEALRGGDVAGALCDAIARLGATLAEISPRDDDAPAKTDEDNDLPDALVLLD